MKKLKSKKIIIKARKKDNKNRYLGLLGERY